MTKLIPAAIAALCLSACAATPAPSAPAPPDYATAPLDLSTPRAAAYSMMLAMYRGDADMVDHVFLEGATLRRAMADGVGPDGLKRWRDWVGKQEVGDAHEELFDIKVEQFGALATVWAPFVISYKGELVGCGVNQMSMAKVAGDWRIVSAMDTQADKESCDTFRESYTPTG